MNLVLSISIVLLGVTSYIIGLWHMVQGSYRPSIFSRVVWLLLAINSFFGVFGSGASTASILLAGILLGGNAAICFLSFWKGSKDFGRLEIMCLGLLTLSQVSLIVYDAPFANLIISLLTHFIAGLPTFKKVWNDSKSENGSFWFLFFVASLLSMFASPGMSLRAILFPLYHTIFNGVVFALTLPTGSSHIKTNVQ